MTPQDLIAAFDTLAEAPDGVKRLRELVLQLALRGKLVRQDSKDGHARVVLDSLRADAERLAMAGAIRRPVALPPVGTADKLFNVPAPWEWSRLQDVGDWGAGSTPLRGDSRYFGGSINWFKSGELPDGPMTAASEERVTEVALAECHLRQNQPGDVLIAMYGATIGRLGILHVPGTTNQAVCACTCFAGLFNRYLFLVLLAWREAFRGNGEGGAQPNISKVKIVTTAIPVPPLAEQHRIVARVDELMVLLDQLEAARAARDDVRRAARDAALAALRDAEDADAVEAAWGRIASKMDSLFSDRDDVGPVRQVVRGLAVRGLLVPPDPGADAAETKDVGECVTFLNGYAFKSEWYVPTGIRLLRNQNVGHGTLAWADVKCVAQDRAEEFGRFRLDAGDIVLSLDRPLISTGLKVAVVTDRDLPCLLLQRVARPQPRDARLDRAYLLLWLNSPDFVDGIDPGRSNGVPHISTRAVERMKIRMPPLAEQHRIVAKVDALMAICDALEARLAAAREVHAKFAAAAVHHLDV